MAIPGTADTPEPDPFDPSAISDETRAMVAGLEAILAAGPSLHELTPKAARELRDQQQRRAGTRLERAQTRTIPGPHGEIGLRLIVPERPRGAYLFVHGGGWMIGAADHVDPMSAEIADTCGVAVIAVDYRKAPEHPHPVAADECEAAARWLATAGADELGIDALAIGGESAGAHLSALTLLRLRGQPTPRPFLAANLVYGCYDLGLTPSVRSWGERNLVLSTPIIEWFVEHYLPDREQRRSPGASPLFADLSGLPPALFTVGTLDPLLDDSMFMHARWRAAGGESTLAIHPGGIHGFNYLPGPLAAAANQRIFAFLGARLAGMG